jgi:glyoxylase I family protein
MLQSPHHTGINVSDWERSKKFYRDTLGLEFLFEAEASGSAYEQASQVPGGRIKFCYFRVGSSLLELIHFVNPPAGPNRIKNHDTGGAHFAFRVADIDKAYRELTSRGVKFNAAPTRIDSGPLVGCAFTYFVDPDGFLLEVFEDNR